MKRFLKEFTKGFITRYFNLHSPGMQKDILILSSPRSGSTWLMELIYTQPGVKYINEPLGKNILDYKHFLPIKTRWNYICLDEYEKGILKEYFIKDKAIKYFGPKNIFSVNYNFFTNRRVIKCIRANELIDWFLTECGFNCIYLIRHPLSQSLSCIKRGHHVQVEEYLADDRYKERYLNKELIGFIRDIIAHGTDLEKFVVDWCLDNLATLLYIRNKERNGLVFLTYEELVMKPLETIDLLSERLNLTAKERMTKHINVPSMVTDSSTSKTKNNIKKGDRFSLINKWKGAVSDEEEARLFKILERFDIDIYEYHNFNPVKKYLNFG